MTVRQYQCIRTAGEEIGAGIILQIAREACADDRLPSIEPGRISDAEAEEILRTMETAKVLAIT